MPLTHRMARKKLRCLLGIHEWYVDAALIYSVRRCNYCDATEGDVDALDKERARYTAGERPLGRYPQRKAIPADGPRLGPAEPD